MFSPLYLIGMALCFAQPGGFGDDDHCTDKTHQECVSDSHCIWNPVDQFCATTPGGGGFNFCGDLGPEDCDALFFCTWNPATEECFEELGGNFFPCDFMDQEFCDMVDYCNWDEVLGICGFTGGGGGNHMDCPDLGPMECAMVQHCQWNDGLEVCEYSNGGNWDFGFCQDLDQESCNWALHCQWDLQLEECIGLPPGFDPCTGLSIEGCQDLFFCHWNPMMDLCLGGFGGYQPCEDLNFEDCTEHLFCFWDEENQYCGDLFGGNQNQHFSNILNGHLMDYLSFMDTTGLGEFHTVTIESIEGGDLGDEIGLLDYNGIINFGDCSDQYGEVLVGAAVWEGLPLTITTFGAMDFCDDPSIDYGQYAGWIEGNPIEIVLWRESENLEYQGYLDEDTGELSWFPIDQNIPLILQPPYDINGDYQIDILDIITAIDFVLGFELLDEENQIKIDMNDDGAVDILDIVALIDFILSS